MIDSKMEIDLKKIKNNTNILCNYYNDYKYIFVDLRDNAHGLGLNIVDTLVDTGINYLYVDTLKSAISIRKHNKDVNILLNTIYSKDEVYDSINNNISLTIYSINDINNLLSLDIKDELKLHILIDNGSNLRGINTKDELEKAIELINSNNNLKLVGIYTDLTTTGVLDESFYKQIYNFNNIIKNVKGDYIIHLNEPIMYHKKLNYVNGIRFDLSILGIEDNIDDSFFCNMKIKEISNRYNSLEFPDINLELVFSILSNVLDIKQVYKGSVIGKNIKIKENMDVAIVPIGYKDGITKAINYVGINGKRREILYDAIDYLVVKIDKDVSINDTVYVLNEEREIYDFLDLLNTNRYYLMSILDHNLKKVYINKESNRDIL